MGMNKNFIGLFIASGLAVNVNLYGQPQEESLPNIVFVLADDMGIGDLGCYGQTKIKTPNIDKLAERGILFTHHYSGSTVSAPSRCCLMTGKHTGHAYVRGNKGMKTADGVFDLALPVEEMTVAELLKSKGYKTMCVGKWGLGGPNTEGSPIRKGFDYFFGYLSQSAAHRYYPEFLYENEEKVMLGGEVYSHFLIMEKGLKFIKENSTSPFFAYFAITPPHADLDYPDLSQYEDSFPETPYINNSNRGFKTQLKPKAAYAAMVSEIDKNVGQIITLLKEEGVWENTIFIFSSDNGVHRVGGHDPDFFDSNGPFRGYKRDLYEGGVRVPFIVNWPAVIKERRVTDNISTFWDFLPTVADIVGVEVPENIDGLSYLPVLQGEDCKARQHEYIYYEFYEQGGKQSILKDGWKLVKLNMANPEKMVQELYNLNSDPGETNNVINLYPDKAEELNELTTKARTPSIHFRWEQKPKKKK
ncbi:arylsulfatase [Barnesiella viscericola DSM 18177]|uniref:Arylsulfatase n=1 Tax=Barnesiella viscericola DSM 18177 TaxID=880074 RepID=W0EN77_9BACT|nr:arylsulfatase [Barnesiella viscericola]AHF12207.1 arylsulfatase [Barnesiella viscericola DSM 18177]